jgi:N-methylhydantoinase B
MAVLVNDLRWITEEMNAYLTRSAFSTNVKVRLDCSCAVYTRDGDMLAQGEFIPVHLGTMSQTLKEVIRDHPVDSLKPGDAIIHNDPFRFGSHLWDIMIFKPIFQDGKLLAWAGNLAHHVDIGGSSLQFSSPTIFEEGLRIPPIKIMKAGVLQEDIVKIITTNVRTPHEVKGDLMAQTAANYRGEHRILELAKKYGANNLIAYFDEILDYSERGMRKAIAAIPSCEASFEDYMETDGISDILTKIKVNVIIKGSDIYLDFKGSGKSGKGGINSTWALSHSAAYYAVKAVMGPQIPTNAGAYRPIHLIRPEGDTMVDARFPHAVGCCTGASSERLIEVIIGAFSRIVPEKTCACDGNHTGGNFIGVDPRTRRYSSYVEAYAVGRGAKYNDDGADAHVGHISNTANAPTEIIELEHPLKVNKYALVPDSGGAGKYRGGVALIRELTLLTECDSSIWPFRPKIKPYGLYGGEGGANDAGGIILDGKIKGSSKNIPAGTTAFMRTSGGGGWGDPLEREEEKVEWDAINGYISLQSAREKYGCVIDPETYKIDAKATKALRSKMKISRSKSK